MKNKTFKIFGLITLSFIVSSCTSSLSNESISETSLTSTTSEITTSVISDSSISTSSGIPIWDGNSVVYSPQDIRGFGSGTPAGVANYESSSDTVIIWNIDASLDNYGGVQTPRLLLDFSKAVIFEMDVISSYSQYIVKLAVEGESEYYYVLSDEGTPGLISINVVDAMLSTKYREKNTQPDPGYVAGWKYADQTKNCTFHVLAKGPDGERQTAELVLGHIAIYNNQPAVTGVTIESSEIIGGKIEKLKNSSPVNLQATIAPSSISDQTILWQSSNENIVTITSMGQLSFVGVGTTSIIAKSRVDQSKQATLIINVLSGFENPITLTSELTSLAVDGSSTDEARFLDLFATTWGADINQPLEVESMVALDHHSYNDELIIENYFDASNSTHISEAQARLIQGMVGIGLTLQGTSSATMYRLIDGLLYQEEYAGSFKAAYATNSPAWTKLPQYNEKGIIILPSGEVRKYQMTMLAAELLSNLTPSDFMNTDNWIVPDRTRQTEDAIIHALSPASLRIEGDQLVMRQNKYPEAKYCFGGIVSQLHQVEASQEVQILLNITRLNQMSDYIKTMWEVKIIYYQAGGTVAVSSNPLKVASSNKSGLHTITFNPTYDYFRLYLVVNGSDIGAQFADAEMRLSHMKMYAMD